MSSEFVLVLGAVASLLMTELLGVSPGGVIVPGYVALYLGSPARLVATAIDALAALGAVRLLGRYAILFGRRRYAAFLLAGFLVRCAMELALPRLVPDALPLRAVGWLVPGIVAADADRQGPLPTLAALAAAAIAVRLAWLALS